MKRLPFREGLSPGEFVEMLWNQHYSTLELYVKGFSKRHGLRQLSVEDVLQNFFLAIMEKHELFARGYRETGLPYLLRALKNQLINWGRKKKDYNFPEEDQFNGKYAGMVVQDSPDFYLSLEYFYILIDQHLKKDSQLIKLWIEAYTYKEISEKLDMKLGTVGVRISRCKEKVEKLWRMSFLTPPRRDQNETQ